MITAISSYIKVIKESIRQILFKVREYNIKTLAASNKVLMQLYTVLNDTLCYAFYIGNTAQINSYSDSNFPRKTGAFYLKVVYYIIKILAGLDRHLAA